MRQEDADIGRSGPSALSAAGDPANESGTSAAYAALLRQFGEAMLRIGRLEARLDDLARQDRGGAEQEALRHSPQAGGDAGKSSGPESAPANDRRDEELRQLRVQITGLAQQLAYTQDQLEEAQSRRRSRRRSHKDPPRPLWKKMAGRLGLQQSRNPT